LHPEFASRYDNWLADPKNDIGFDLEDFNRVHNIFRAVFSLVNVGGIQSRKRIRKESY